MSKIQFFFTGHSKHTATGVTDWLNYQDSIHYTQEKTNTDGSVKTFTESTVQKHDLLYAVVTDEDGEVVIIPGIFKKFTVTPSSAEMRKQNNIEEEQARIIKSKKLKNKRKADKAKAKRKDKFVK